MQRLLRRRSAEQGARAWFLRAHSPAPEPAPKGRGVQGEGQTQGPAERAGRREQGQPCHRPSGSWAVRFPVWRETPAKPNRAKRGGGKSRPEGARRRPGHPYPGLIHTPLPGPCPPLAFGKGAGPAGCARPLICREGGGRASWGLFVTLLPRSPRSPGSGLRRSLPLAAAASAGAICCCRFWRSAIQKQTSSMTTNSYSQMY